MFVGQAVHTLKLDYELLLDENISEILSDRVTFVTNRKRGLRPSPNTAKSEFFKERPLSNFLQKSSAQSVRNLNDSANHLLSQRVKICVHLCSSAANHFRALLNRSFSARSSPLHPAQTSTGNRGYFANRASTSASKHR